MAPGSPFLSKTGEIALAGLTQAIWDGAPLDGVLPQITQQLNAAAARYAASNG